MLEERLCLIEGAEACRTTATGMAAVNAALLSHLKAGDRVVASRALFGSCHWIVSTLLPNFGIETRVRRRRRPGAMARGAVDADAAGAAGNAVQPDAGDGRPAGGRRPGACGRRDRRGRQRVRHAAAAAAAEARRRRRGLFLHQAHRRPGPRARRRGARQQEVDQRDAAAVHPQHRPGAVAVQRLGAAEGAGDAGAAGRCRLPRRRGDRRLPGGAARGDARLVSDPRRPPAAGAGDAADDGRRHGGHVRGRRRQGRARSG